MDVANTYSYVDVVLVMKMIMVAVVLYSIVLLDLSFENVDDMLLFVDYYLLLVVMMIQQHLMTYLLIHHFFCFEYYSTTTIVNC